MLKLRRILTLIALFVVTMAFGQQDPLFTQYMFNPGQINPAVTGSSEIKNISSTFRKQWVGIDGAPTTMAISYDGAYRGNTVGLGGTLIHDIIGPVIQTGLYVNYGYHIELDNDQKLSFGLLGGFNYYQFDLTKLQTHEPDDDINLAGYNSKFLPNFGYGMLYQTKNYYMGFSIPKLIKNSLEEIGNVLSEENKEERHFFLMAAYLFEVNSWLDLKPSGIARVVSGAPVSVDFTANAILQDKINLGLTYRLNGAIGAIVGWQLTDRMFMAYSFDYSGRLQAYNSGTHELFLSFNISRYNERVLSPRYF